MKTNPPLSEPGTMAEKHKPLFQHAAAAFSLIELLVVIGVIIILVAILVINAPLDRGPQAITKNIIQELKSIESEYVAVTRQRINSHKYITSPFDWNSENGGAYNGSLEEDSIRRFLYAARQISTCRTMIENLEKKYEEYTDPPNNIIYDGWDQLIVYMTFSDDDDGQSEDAFLANLADPYVALTRGTAARPQPFFASRGSDGEWGTKYNNDDIYSFEIK